MSKEKIKQGMKKYLEYIASIETALTSQVQSPQDFAFLFEGNKKQIKSTVQQYLKEKLSALFKKYQSQRTMDMAPWVSLYLLALRFESLAFVKKIGKINKQLNFSIKFLETIEGDISHVIESDFLKMALLSQDIKKIEHIFNKILNDESELQSLDFFVMVSKPSLGSKLNLLKHPFKHQNQSIQTLYLDFVFKDYLNKVKAPPRLRALVYSSLFSFMKKIKCLDIFEKYCSDLTQEAKQILTENSKEQGNEDLHAFLKTKFPQFFEKQLLKTMKI